MSIITGAPERCSCTAQILCSVLPCNTRLWQRCKKQDKGWCPRVSQAAVVGVEMLPRSVVGCAAAALAAADEPAIRILHAKLMLTY
jgi:hypothetical protein